MSKKRVLFSTHLMTSVVILVTGSVVLISVVLFIYLGQRLDAEFKNQLRAQKGQVETILATRIADIKQQVEKIANDNSLRVTLLMDDSSRLIELAEALNSDIAGVSFFVRKRGLDEIYPHTSPRLSSLIFQRKEINQQSDSVSIPHTFLEDQRQKRFLWLFEFPILHNEGRMGTVFALYDMIKDIGLANTLGKGIRDSLFIVQPNRLVGLFGAQSLPLPPPISNTSLNRSGFTELSDNMTLIAIDGFPDLFFSANRKELIVEKRNIALFIGLFTFSVLTVSVFFSVVLGKRLAEPLSEMANKAYHISRGSKGINFNITNGDYTEFQRLSHVFNDMLVKLRDMEEKARYTELMENVDDAVYLVDETNTIIQSNEATRLQLGYSVENPLNIEHDSILPEKDVRTLRNLLMSGDDQTRRKATIETSHISRDGSLIPVEIKARVIDYRGKKVILHVARDIRNRIEAEKALRESEQRYRSVVESSHDGIMIVDDQHVIVYANEQICRTLGYERHEIETTPFKEILSDSILDFTSNPHSSIRPKDKNSFAFTRKDGEDRHGSIRFTHIKDPDGNRRVVIQLLDITEQLRTERENRQLEAQLLHSQKMEAIGTLAGGVAHDFNNLLQVIHGYTELLMGMKKKDDPDLKQLREIKNASQRASDLTDQLLTFSRKTEGTTLPINLTSEVEQGYRLLSRTLPSSIRTSLYLADDLKIIHADPGRIQQVILNLGVNARDAMPEGGELTIETKNIVLDEIASKKYLEAKPGDYVRLSITDTGHGMDEETIKHIFEPFFTTKSTGKGTGLGMSIVYGIVQDAGGYITCYSKVGIGTTFRIYFPATEKSPMTETNTTISEKTTPPAILNQNNDEPEFDSNLEGTETILLVDDEERIRSLGVMLLSQYGYTVLTAKDGIEALAVYQAKKDTIDLVIIDLIMPEMDGRKCFSKLKKIDPKIKVIMSSGYAVSPKEIKQEGVKAFIDKPYEIQTMLETIRETINGGAEPM